MRLTTVILIASLMQVSASGLAQKISLSESNTSLKAILKALKTQSGYNFVVTDAQLKKATPVNIRVKNAGLEDVLNQVFEKQPLEFEIESKTVIVKDKEPSFLDRIMARFAAIDVRGRVVDEQGKPLVGATVRVKISSTGTSGGMDKMTKTNANGEFFLSNVDEDATIQIVFIGYRTKELKAASDLGSINLEESVGELEQVDVTYNTGYQKVDPTKATGSFVQIDSALFNRRVGATVLERLDGVTSSLIFNNSTLAGSQRRTGQSSMTIRGRSTIFSDAEPLIVLDNFPYEGDVNNLNPNDIESVTILRDAAAASIWGSRAGNGVIVITTKSGRYNQKQNVSFNSNVSIAEKPDLYYTPRMTNEEFIENEQFLFGKGLFDFYLNSQPFFRLSPVVNLLQQRRLGTISETELNQQLDVLKVQDTRRDIDKYVNRTGVNQQYAFNIQGGSFRNQYYFSGGYDKGQASVRNSSSNRYTLNGKNTYAVIPNKLELSTNLIFTKSKSIGSSTAAGIYPYELLADANGNALSIGGYSDSWADTVGNGRLLDWKRKPLDEMSVDRNKSTRLITDYLVNTTLSYKIIPSLEANIQYQYKNQVSQTEQYYSADSYMARDLVNNYSQINLATGQVSYFVPKGGILDQVNSTLNVHSLRGQVNFSKLINTKHEIRSIAGLERRAGESLLNPNQRLYGYDPYFESYGLVDYTKDYPNYRNPATTTFIPNNQSGTLRSRGHDNFLSYFGNVAYSYLGRYHVSFSARKDESNIFGVRTNQKGVPLWSAGASWNIGKEDFYAVNWLPDLKLRITQGYNGNVNRSVTAYPTAGFSASNRFNQPYIAMTNPPNPELQWEKIKITNVGLDFALRHQILSGSVEFYFKKGRNLIGTSPLAPSLGVTIFRGNTADMEGKGFDISLNSTNINRELKWTTFFLLSHTIDKVTDYKVSPGNNGQLFDGNSINPVVGKPIYSVFAYKWAGLDPLTGDPQSYLNGEVSKNYTAISTSTDVNELRYMGTATPTVFGNIRNHFAFKRIELSFNIMYKLDYYFRRYSIDYTNLLTLNSTQGLNSVDYKKRWQNPGDELITNVPSLIYPNNGVRNSVYNYSEILVEKGDHIRLQDLQFSYLLNKGISRLKVSNIRVYFYANNLGLLWKANKHQLDPDFIPGVGGYVYPNPRSYAFGINVNF